MAVYTIHMYVQKESRVWAYNSKTNENLKEDLKQKLFEIEFPIQK